MYHVGATARQLHNQDITPQHGETNKKQHSTIKIYAGINSEIGRTDHSLLDIKTYQLFENVKTLHTQYRESSYKVRK